MIEFAILVNFVFVFVLSFFFFFEAGMGAGNGARQRIYQLGFPFNSFYPVSQSHFFPALIHMISDHIICM